jgi:acetyl-CoA C-acetyltransferase/acetyl-CoA acyltransferase
LARIGVEKKDAIEVMGWAQVIRNITNDPTDLTELETIKKAAHQAMESADISVDQVGTLELHDCFSIAGILVIEALGLAKPGEGCDYVAEGKTSRNGELPTNTTGGLIGWGHPTGATGVHQAVTIWQQLTGKAGQAQIEIKAEKPYGMTINMGGDDVTVVAVVYKKGA